MENRPPANDKSITYWTCLVNQARIEPSRLKAYLPLDDKWVAVFKRSDSKELFVFQAVELPPTLDEELDEFVEELQAHLAGGMIHLRAEHKAMGIPLAGLKDGWIVYEHPDDSFEKIKRIERLGGQLEVEDLLPLVGLIKNMRKAQVRYMEARSSLTIPLEEKELLGRRVGELGLEIDQELLRLDL